MGIRKTDDQGIDHPGQGIDRLPGVALGFGTLVEAPRCSRVAPWHQDMLMEFREYLKAANLDITPRWSPAFRAGR